LASATIGALAELPENANQLASALAVLGQRTPLAVVARVAAVAGPAAALESLLKTGFLQWFPDQRDTPIDFVHPLYRLAVYDDLSPTRRQLLHRAAAGNLGRVAGWPHRAWRLTAPTIGWPMSSTRARLTRSTGGIRVWRPSTCCGRRH
jgi:predicted ATPase